MCYIAILASEAGLTTHTYHPNKYSTERGNALFIILLAVALIAALTMTLSRSGSSVVQSGNIEQQRVQGSQLLRYAKSIETAIQQIKLRGISENDISFENATTTTDYTNANCTSTDCRLFDVGGAGLAYRNFSSANDGSDWIFTGANNIGTTAGPIGTTADGSGNDIIMLLPNVRSSLCVQINRDLGVGTAGTLPEDTTGIATTAFTGSFPTGGPTILEGDPGTILNNQTTGCFIDTAPNPDITYFYYVVLAR